MGGWWRHRNPGQLVAHRIGAPDARTALTPISGSAPQALVGLAPERIARGHLDVNCIAPGITASEAEGSPYREMLEQRAALRAVGEPNELCGALLLFCAPACAWITGQVLNVDGGFIMRP